MQIIHYYSKIIHWCQSLDLVHADELTAELPGWRRARIEDELEHARVEPLAEEEESALHVHEAALDRLRAARLDREVIDLVEIRPNLLPRHCLIHHMTKKAILRGHIKLTCLNEKCELKRYPADIQLCQKT